jgi:hypothetical protein
VKPSLDHTHYRGLFRNDTTACGLRTNTKGIKIASMQPLVTCPVCRGEVSQEDYEAEIEAGGLTSAETGMPA